MKPSLRTFKIQKDFQGNEIEIHISETPGLKAENLSLATWGSSYILANRLHRWREDAARANGNTNRAQSISANGDRKSDHHQHQPIAVLELGAGTSLVGISAAAVWQLPVIVTDLDPLVLGLAQNVHVNEKILGERGGEVECGTLDWSRPRELYLYQDGDGEERQVIDTSKRKANMILAADTVYAEDHPELLTKTISTCLAPGADSRVILCYVLRHSYIDIIRDLWESFESIGLECAEEGQQDADPDTWDDVAPFEWCVWRWKQTQESLVDGSRS